MNADDEDEETEEDVPLSRLPGPWQELMLNGQLLTALILSTSYSEKYKGRHLYPGDPSPKVEVRLPTPSGTQRSVFSRLLHRSGNKEAVAFIWLGDETADDKTLYVAFSPMRYRSQFFKIYCAAMVQDVPSEDMGKHISFWQSGDRPTAGALLSSGRTVLPISAYVHGKLRRMWSQQGLWKGLTECVEKYPSHKIIFAGISHGAALAQAAAVQFRLCREDVDVYVVTWNAYRWTDSHGRRVAEGTLGDKLLPFVLSRRGESKATRYWDSVTGFPRGYKALHNPILLDADTGHLYEHTAPEKTSNFGAVAMMRFFELHFARCALIATKKCMALALGQTAPEGEESYLVAPVAERLQESLISTGDKIVKRGHSVRRQASAEIASVRTRITNASEDIRQKAEDRFTALRSSGNSGTAIAIVEDAEDDKGDSVHKGKKPRPLLRRLAWCCHS